MSAGTSMASLRETISRHSTIVGLKWKRLENNSNKNTEKRSADSPVTRSMSRREALTENVFVEETGTSKEGFLRRARSVRDAFGTLRQKLRVSTRRKKRLLNNNSPLPSFTSTPASQRRSARKNTNDVDGVKMYSPFMIDTPGTRTTPRAIRMGIHQPKRFHFESPGKVERDINAVSDGIQALSHMGDELDKAIQGVTPNRPPFKRPSHAPSEALTRRHSQRRKPIFV